VVFPEWTAGDGCVEEQGSLLDYSYLVYYPRTMARQLRLEYEGALYHITSRGNAQKGYRFVLDADIKGFFDEIPHKLIMDLISREISDSNILSLIKKFLQAGVMEEGKVQPTDKGTPQGGLCKALHNPPWGEPFSG
jgi:hypothetical protein